MANHGRTAYELADDLGISHQIVYNMCNGKTRIRLDQLPAISRSLPSMSTYWLWSGKERIGQL